MFASDRFEQVLDQVTKIITSALNAPHPRDEIIEEALLYLTKLEDRSGLLAVRAYGWCAIIWANRRSYNCWEGLLCLSLRVGFRRLDPRAHIDLVLTEHHREMAGSIFESNRCGEIEDLLVALNQHSIGRPAVKSLGKFKRYLINLHNTAVPFSPRLQQLVLESVALIGYEGFEEVGIENFFGFLNHLSTGVEVTDIPAQLCYTLLDAARSPGGHRYLTLQSWGLLANLTAECSWWCFVHYNPRVTSSLLEAHEWEKLECWMGVVWMMWPPLISDVPEDLKNAMESLLRNRPGAVRKLTEWMERSSERRKSVVPESFEQICEQARQAAL